MDKIKFVMLWETDRWDGPVCGVGHTGKKWVWFDRCKDRKFFNLYVLGPEDFLREFQVHTDFLKMVRFGTTFGFEDKDDLKPNWMEFYNVHPVEESRKRHTSYINQLPCLGAGLPVSKLS